MDTHDRLGDVTKTTYQSLKVKDYWRLGGVLGTPDPGVNVAEQFARRYPGSPHIRAIEHRLQTLVKGDIPAASSAAGSWGEALVPNELGRAYAAFVAPFTLVGRFGVDGIPGFVRTPFNTAVAYSDPVTMAATVGFIGRAMPKPLVAASIARLTLEAELAALLVVVTDEHARFDAPNSEDFIARLVATAIGQGLDRLLVDETNAGANSTPAALTYGITPIAGTGDPEVDLAALIAAFVAGGGQLSSAVILLSSANATALSLRGAPYDRLTVRGGVLAGLPALASDSVGERIVLIDTSRVLLGDNNDMLIERARAASIQMVDNPTNSAAGPTATSTVSMWQSNSVCLRVERIINWKRTSDAAVQWIDGASYLTSTP